ncbi:MAG TPA: hypothetical protein VHU21_23655 [Paraburkholderia sp.]|jgi:hypothetical protein|nr:hypothetical protein [Paraburkholderia sp.]
MKNSIPDDPCRPALVAIASHYLEINSLEETGRKLGDMQFLRVSNLADALEQAYQMGFVVGYNAEPE